MSPEVSYTVVFISSFSYGKYQMTQFKGTLGDRLGATDPYTTLQVINIFRNSFKGQLCQESTFTTGASQYNSTLMFFRGWAENGLLTADLCYTPLNIYIYKLGQSSKGVNKNVFLMHLILRISPYLYVCD